MDPLITTHVNRPSVGDTMDDEVSIARSDPVSFSRYLKKKSNSIRPSDNISFFSPERITNYLDSPALTILFSYPIILDSLFFFIPMFNEEAKCLVLDQKLKNIALVFRSFSDLGHIIGLIRVISSLIQSWRAGRGFVLEKSVYRRGFFSETRRGQSAKGPADCVDIMLLLLGLFNFLPIPQIGILIFLPKVRGSKSWDRIKIMNSLIVLQYLIRAYPFFFICKELNKLKVENSIYIKSKSSWVSGAINFTVYISACHVLGALWYFFSFQRLIDCWIHNCTSENGCELSNLYCGDHKTFRNVTLLNDFCPINPSNATLYDFGIYLDALQSGMLQSTDFPQKFLQCFAWGLRNLSSFGSNLKTTADACENLFVALISIIGLLLFIYLLGHLQTFMQATNRSIWLRVKTRPQIHDMLSTYSLPKDLEPVIWSMIQDSLHEEHEYHAERIFFLLPKNLKKDIKLHLFLPTLEELGDNICMQETKGESMDKQVLLKECNKKKTKLLEKICKHLDPMKFNGINYIIREGEPLDMMFFITQGTVLTYTTNNVFEPKFGEPNGGSSSSSPKRDYYGEELLKWAATCTNGSSSNIPISRRTVKSQKEVEVFAITATDLQRIVSKFFRSYNG